MPRALGACRAARVGVTCPSAWSPSSSLSSCRCWPPSLEILDWMLVAYACFWLKKGLILALFVTTGVHNHVNEHINRSNTPPRYHASTASLPRFVGCMHGRLKEGHVEVRRPCEVDHQRFRADVQVAIARANQSTMFLPRHALEMGLSKAQGRYGYLARHQAAVVKVSPCVQGVAQSVF